jgi:hypothetical protein
MTIELGKSRVLFWKIEIDNSFTESKLEQPKKDFQECN